MKVAAMTDTLPDHLSNDPRSPHFNAELLQRDIGIRFNGVEKNNVEEYCVSEGWIRVAAGKAKDRFGNPLTIKLTGKVEPYFRDKKEVIESGDWDAMQQNFLDKFDALNHTARALTENGLSFVAAKNLHREKAEIAA